MLRGCFYLVRFDVFCLVFTDTTASWMSHLNLELKLVWINAPTFKPDKNDKIAVPISLAVLFVIFDYAVESGLFVTLAYSSHFRGPIITFYLHHVFLLRCIRHNTGIFVTFSNPLELNFIVFTPVYLSFIPYWLFRWHDNFFPIKNE